MVAPRPVKTTVKFIDEYCENYRDLFNLEFNCFLILNF
jgi:hypothetical protein